MQIELEDSESIEKRLKEMGIDLPSNKIKAYTEKQESVRKILAQNKFSINNNQFACAVAALCDSRYKRTLLSIPPGKGKSRVIAAIIAL